MKNSRVNTDDTKVQDGYAAEHDSEHHASPAGSGEPTTSSVAPASSGLSDELAEGGVMIGVRRWSDLFDRRKISSS